MSRRFEAVVGYLQYVSLTQSKFHIHSPFVFDFYANVLMNAGTRSHYRVIDRIRKELETVPRYIKRKDFGSKEKDFPSDQRFVRVRDVAVRTSVNRKKGEFLFRLIRRYHLENILELGTSLGISTIYLGLAAPAGKIITLEGCIDSANLATENFEKAGLDHIRVITGTFEEKLAEAFTLMPEPDLIFIDGNHRKVPTLVYFEACLQHIRPDTVLVLDDIYWSAEMQQAWKLICNHPRVKVTINLYQMGVVFFKEELSKENFILHF
ncbi:MAG: SAM-dependent methyltransferase [Alphaproteobacteria bacterium]|nr:SAM-dependent methyltransferase [Alphaproteobacteria bacterium]